jgi:hypothetical protein
MRALAAAPRRIAVDLSAETIERVAVRVAQLLRQGLTEPAQSPAPARLITAGELARHLRVERPWVYRHRHLLGGRRIGAGPRAPWRFELETATKALGGHRVERGGNRAQPGDGR